MSTLLKKPKLVLIAAEAYGVSNHLMHRKKCDPLSRVGSFLNG